jgi:hypothetical protein
VATVQQSIEVKVSPDAAYHQLAQFETYPRFMEYVESVQRLDDTHLHWTTQMADRSMEWDAEITEQEPGRCIAWHNTSGPTNTGRVDVQALGADSAQVTITLHAEPQQMPGSMADYTEEEMARRLKQDLARLKELIESNGTGAEAGARHHALQGMDAAGRDPGLEAAGATKQTEQTVQPQPVRPGGNAPTSTVVGSAGGTDAAAGAQLSGSKGGPDGPSPRKTTDTSGSPGATTGERTSPAAGAGAAGGTGLGSTASASDTRSGTGSTSGAGTTLTGGGTSGARDVGVSSGKGRAS